MSPEFFGPGNFGPLDQSFSKLWSGEPLFQEFCSPGHILSQIEISMTGKLFTQPTWQWHFVWFKRHTCCTRSIYPLHQHGRCFHFPGDSRL